MLVKKHWVSECSTDTTNFEQIKRKIRLPNDRSHTASSSINTLLFNTLIHSHSNKQILSLSLSKQPFSPPPLRVPCPLYRIRHAISTRQTKRYQREWMKERKKERKKGENKPQKILTTRMRIHLLQCQETQTASLSPIVNKYTLQTIIK